MTLTYASQNLISTGQVEKPPDEGILGMVRRLETFSIIRRNAFFCLSISHAQRFFLLLNRFSIFQNNLHCHLFKSFTPLTRRACAAKSPTLPEFCGGSLKKSTSGRCFSFVLLCMFHLFDRRTRVDIAVCLLPLRILPCMAFF